MIEKDHARASFAARLGLPMIAVRPDCVVDCWLGSTGRNLGQLFRLACPEPKLGRGPVVMFFDEFEALASKRVGGATNAQREKNDVVDVLLQRIESHPGIIIAATNHADQLDPAIWRRFDIHISVDLPGPRERELILQRYLAPYGLPSQQITALSTVLDTASPALMRQLCEGLKRTLVLGEQLGWDMRRSAVFDRILSAIEPHPDLGKPTLWALGSKAKEVREITWPFPMATEIADDLEPDWKEPSGKVVQLSSLGEKRPPDTLGNSGGHP